MVEGWCEFPPLQIRHIDEESISKAMAQAEADQDEAEAGGAEPLGPTPSEFFGLDPIEDGVEFVDEAEVEAKERPQASSERKTKEAPTKGRPAESKSGDSGGSGDAEGNDGVDDAPPFVRALCAAPFVEGLPQVRRGGVLFFIGCASLKQ